MSYHLRIISSFVMKVVQCAIIQAATIAPHHLKSVVATYHP
ncbi:MAG: hypothetical protein ACOZBL_01495 [Patescibacteria group bacterium]